MHLSIASRRRAPSWGPTTVFGKSRRSTQSVPARAAAPAPGGSRGSAPTRLRAEPLGPAPAARSEDTPNRRCRINNRVLTSAFSSALVAAILGATCLARICLGESTAIRHHGEQRCPAGDLTRSRGLRGVGAVGSGVSGPLKQGRGPAAAAGLAGQGLGRRRPPCLRRAAPPDPFSVAGAPPPPRGTPRPAAAGAQAGRRGAVMWQAAVMAGAAAAAGRRTASLCNLRAARVRTSVFCPGAVGDRKVMKQGKATPGTDRPTCS